MRNRDLKTWTKQLLGWFPASAGVYQRVLAAGMPPADGYSLEQLESYLPSWVRAATSNHPGHGVEGGHRIFVFGYLRWWLEYGVALSLLLRHLGHEVSFGFLPYRRWAEAVGKFDARRQSEYLRDALSPLRGIVGVLDLSDPARGTLPEQLKLAAEEQAWIDLQYTLQREQIDLPSDREATALFDLRLDRNKQAAHAFANLAGQHDWDAVVLPNGSILEFGMLYRVARDMGLRTATYEFGEQRERIWLAVNDEVMLQDTSDLWRRRGNQPLTDGESEAVSDLYRARMSGKQWGNFTRTWQSGEVRGEDAVREELAIDPEQPTFLLCTNVVGDSLALKRQIFTQGMADWLAQSVQALAMRGDVNLIVRVHPGELLGAGHPSLDIVQETLPELPPHVRLIAPESPINTYDLIDIADAGLVYTTTVGLEMAMRGLPVLVAGQTHYRGKGFTLDPETLDEYLALLKQLIEMPESFRLKQSQINRAWHYAYLFFFEYPQRFPWHLLDFWQDIETKPFDQVIRPIELNKYRPALQMISGSSLGLGEGLDGG
ncbi:MAG: hypothetical protein P8X64_15320 [Anaerolineales bacterium]